MGNLTFIHCEIVNMYHWGYPIISGDVVRLISCRIDNFRGIQTSHAVFGNDLDILKCELTRCCFEGLKMFSVKGAEHSFTMRECKLANSGVSKWGVIVGYKSDDGYKTPFGFYDCCFVNVTYNQLSYATGLGVATQINMSEQEFDLKFSEVNGG